LSEGELAGTDGGEAAGEDGSLGLLTAVGGLADDPGPGPVVHALSSRPKIIAPQISAPFATLVLIGLTAFLRTPDPSGFVNVMMTGATIPPILYEAARTQVPSRPKGSR